MTTEPIDQLSVERLVDAPIEAVWQAWTTKAGLASWWWSGWDDTTYDIDVRVGGSYRIAVPSVGIAVSGEFVTVTAPHRLEMTWIWNDGDGTGPSEHVAVDLATVGPKTRVTVRHGGPWTTDDQAANYRQGWNDVLDALIMAARSDRTDATDRRRATVTGVGGVFFRSSEPTATLEWYRDHLGLVPEEGFPCATLRWSGGETTVWAPFDSTTDHFGGTAQEFMVNYRVDDLDALVEQLRDQGIDVTETMQLPNGDFAWATDCDGRRLELWQPAPGQ